MITDNPAALRGSKSYRDPNTQKTRENKERMAGISVVLRVCEATEALLGKARRKPIKPRARRCRQGKAAPAAVRIQHKDRAPRGKVTEYRRRNREVQTQEENETTTVRKPGRNETSGDRSGREKTNKNIKKRGGETP